MLTHPQPPHQPAPTHTQFSLIQRPLLRPLAVPAPDWHAWRGHVAVSPVPRQAWAIMDVNNDGSLTMEEIMKVGGTGLCQARAWGPGGGGAQEGVGPRRGEAAMARN